MSSAPEPPVVIYPDRRSGLVAFGILEIVVGGLALFTTAVGLSGMLVTAREPVPLYRVALDAMFGAGLAALFIVVGVGSLRARRWARALSLVIGWSWLVFGLSFMLTMVPLMLSGLFKVSHSQGQDVQDPARVIFMIGGIRLLCTGWVVFPGAMIFFYGSRDVRATCEARNPSPCWTDVCPLPVLGLGFWLGIESVTMLFEAGSADGAVPGLGHLVPGVGGSLFSVALAALGGYCAWAVYRMRAMGWWIALMWLCVILVSRWITLRETESVETTRLRGLSEPRIEATTQSSASQGGSLRYLALAPESALFGFAIFVRRYFRPPA